MPEPPPPRKKVVVGGGSAVTQYKYTQLMIKTKQISHSIRADLKIKRHKIKLNPTYIVCTYNEYYDCTPLFIKDISWQTFKSKIESCQLSRLLSRLLTLMWQMFFLSHDDAFTSDYLIKMISRTLIWDSQGGNCWTLVFSLPRWLSELQGSALSVSYWHKQPLMFSLFISSNENRTRAALHHHAGL